MESNYSKLPTNEVSEIEPENSSKPEVIELEDLASAFGPERMESLVDSLMALARNPPRR
jgi:hypothetical protein